MTLSQTRRTVSRRLAGQTLPLAFEQATCAAAANAYERDTVSAKASRRRLNEKALKITAVASSPCHYCGYISCCCEECDARENPESLAMAVSQ